MNENPLTNISDPNAEGAADPMLNAELGGETQTTGEVQPPIDKSAPAVTDPINPAPPPVNQPPEQPKELGVTQEVKEEIPAWAASLSENIKKSRYVSQYENVSDLVDGMDNKIRNAESLIGKKVNQWKEDDWKGYKQVKGISTSPNDYKLEVDKLYIQEPFVSRFKEIVSRRGISQEDAQSIFEEYNAINKEAVEEREVTERETAKELHREFGNNVEQKRAAVYKVLKQFGTTYKTPKLADKLINESRRDADIGKFIIRLADEFIEEKEGVNMRGDVIRVDAQSELDKMVKDPQKREILTDPGHPDFKRMQARKEELSQSVNRGMEHNQTGYSTTIEDF